MKKFRIIISILLILGAIFIARIAYFQLFTEKYKLNAENTSIKAEYQIPLRGYIMDRKGNILVGNIPIYELTYTGSYMTEDFDTLGFCELVQMPKEEFINRINKIKQDKIPPSNPIAFIPKLDNDEIARIQEKIFKYPAFSILQKPERNYLKSSSGNILGYINEVNTQYIKSDSTFYMLGDMAGMAGVEKSYEKYLRGKKGVKYIQKDRLLRNIGSYKNGEFDESSHIGDDIMLTIDYDLQEYAEKLLANKRGAVVAIDPNNGEILALASSPIIDPSKEFTGKDKNKKITKLILDSFNKPMYDRAIQAMYPPGSTFKLVNGLAGLQMGVIDTLTTFTCRHGFVYGNRKINCHCGYFYTPISITKAIQKSCNNFFAEEYVRILNKYPNDIEKSVDEWNDLLKSFGLGKFFGNDLAVGSAGNIPDSKYYNRKYGKGKWNAYTIISNSIGQGEILLTPLQMANFTAIIANRGYYYTPHIIKQINGKPVKNSAFTEKKYTKIKKEYFDTVFKGMVMVMESGTGRRVASTLFTSAGKTGTSQNPHGKDHSIFIMIAPAENPKIAIAVLVENGGFGATFAAPIASLVVEKYLTGTVIREDMEKRMMQGDLNYEYNRQWEKYIKKFNKRDSIK